MKTLKYISIIVFSILIQMPDALATSFDRADLYRLHNDSVQNTDSSEEAGIKLEITELDLELLQNLEVEEQPEEGLSLTGARNKEMGIRLPLHGLIKIEETEEEPVSTI